MNKCAKSCLKRNASCKERKCRMWVDYGDDLNCTLITVNKHGKMTLEEVAKRVNLSFVRVKQIQDKAMQKMKKKSSLIY